MSRKKPVNVQVSLRQTRGDSNKLIRKFIKKCKKEKIVDEYRERMFYEKPSTKRRRLKKRKKENARKAQRERDKKLNIQPETRGK
jgi:ribosomal protein S21